MSTDLRHTASNQVAAAERAVAAQTAAARETSPEYALVVTTTAMGTEVGIYVRGAGTETNWTFLRTQRGTDATLLADALRNQGANVTIHHGMFHYNHGGTWQPTVTRFVPSVESQRLAAEISALYRKADALDAEWANNDRWGESGSRSLRKDAEYKIARLHNLDPGYPIDTLRPTRP